MTSYLDITLMCVVLFVFGTGSCQYIFDCPLTWERYDLMCYEFNYYPTYDYTAALAACHKNGASLVSVNSLAEHNFIISQLRVNDALGQLWLTSGMVNNINTSDMRWEGDGTVIGPADQWWFSEQDRLTDGRRIVYKSQGGVYGWTRVASTTVSPYICEISQSEAYRINEENRDFGYGSNTTDPENVPRGPQFIVQPENMVVVYDYRSTTDLEHFYVSIECMADGSPQPQYRIFQTDTDLNVTEVTSLVDDRYTIMGGRLVISDPIEGLDAGSYQCMAYNDYGTVLSDVANITFGSLGDFSNVQRETVIATEFLGSAIECAPPSFKPAVSFQWYRGVSADFVRPDLNPHMFISSNGKLYFSDVSSTDQSEYHCIVKLTAGTAGKLTTDQPPSKVSLGIQMDVRYSAGSTWGPTIADGFIAAYPSVPLKGFSVKLECLAYGTLPLSYTWRRLNGEMPDNTNMFDHNRIIEITDADLTDAGVYVCTVTRNTEARIEAVYTLVIEATPYFIFPLQDQHADVGSQLTWRCECKGIPTPAYTWYKNGQQVVPVPGDIDVRQNVIIIQSLDAARHNGMYQCAATNRHGTIYSSAQLRVLALAPTFKKYPLNPSQMAALGGNITIVCSPEAAPRPSYSWSHNGVNLNLPDNDDGMSRIRKLSNGNLFISDVQQSDSGQYGCTATNMFGTDTSYGVLQVVYKSVITLTPVNSVGAINQTSVMMCEASIPAGTDYMYAWRFNGHDIDTSIDPFYRQGSTQSQGILYITMSQYKHQGLYECVVKTTLDVTTASAFLTIEGPPGECAGVRVDSTTTIEAMVIWTSGTSHGRFIEYHTVEARSEYNDTWTPAAFNIPVTMTQNVLTDKHNFLVTSLKPGNGYYFRVRATNPLGVGPPSRPSNIYRTLNAPPLRAPSDVRGGGGSVGTLSISWTPLPLEDQGAPGIGYVVRWRKYGETRYQEVTLEGNVGSYSHTVGADNFYLQYEVLVKAFNSLGDGPFSPDGVIIFSAENIPIGVATNVYAWPYNATAIQVSWTVIPNERESMRGTLLGYQVNYWERYDPDPIINAISWRGESDTGIVIGLDPAFWYTVDVQVLNTAGMGPRSELTYSKTYWDAPHAYPTEVHVFSHTEGSMRVTWRGVMTEVGEETLAGYKIRYWTTTDDIDTASDVMVDRDATEAFVYGIQRDRVYELRVLGISRGGDGKQSSSVFFTLGGQVAYDPSSSEILLASAGQSRGCVPLVIFLFLVVSISRTSITT